MFRIRITILLLFITPFLYAQRQIQTERLTRNETAKLVLKGRWQVESGLQYEGASRGSMGQYKLSSPTVLQRYGLTDRVELRLSTAMASNFTRNKASLLSNNYINGLEAPHIGAKILLLKSKKWLPQIAILPQLGIRPLASRAYSSQRVVPNFDFLCSHNVGRRFTLGYNIGSYWDDFFNYTYAVNIQKKWSRTLVSNIEWDGTLSRRNEMRPNRTNNLYGSLGFYLDQNVLVDVGLGKGIQNEPDFFFKSGVSFLLKK